MFKNPFTKFSLNTTRKAFQMKSTDPKNLNFFQKSYYSRLDRFLNNLQRPLYQYLIGANLGVYCLWNSGIISQRVMEDNFTLSLRTMYTHRYHTLLTYGFSHMGGMHLFFNMFSLYFFGKFVEAQFGARTLFQLYLIGTLVSGFFIHSSNSANRNPYPTLGASGATSAILTYFIFNFPNQPIYLFFFPVPAWAVGALMFVQSLWMYDGRGGVSGAGHLGGIVAGLFYYLFKRGRF